MNPSSDHYNVTLRSMLDEHAPAPNANGLTESHRLGSVWSARIFSRQIGVVVRLRGSGELLVLSFIKNCTRRPNTVSLGLA